MIFEIDKQIENSLPELISLTKALVKINSEKGIDEQNAPFGKGPKEVIDKVLEFGRDEDFSCTDYGMGIASVSMKEGAPDLGIWLHGDVVPAGDNWNFPPFEATEYEDCLIGRGVTDNKGQLAAVFILFKIFKKLGIKLKYKPSIYIGSNEETGMEDLKSFLKECNPPRLSLVPDDDFPLGYGGKGGVNITLKSREKLENIHFLCAGSDEKPGNAVAVLKDGMKFEENTPPRHPANPDKNGNMITKLSEKLIESGIVSEKEHKIFEFFRDLSLDTEGKMLEIDTNHPEMGGLTVYAKSVNFADGYPEILLNIRYPLGITSEVISEKITECARRKGFEISEMKCGVEPYLNNPDSEISKLLLSCSEEIRGKEKPYILSGGTYAHRLPNAYVFGMSGNVAPESFPEGRGGAHGVDEAVSLKRLTDAMKIYARALLKLNETEW